MQFYEMASMTHASLEKSVVISLNKHGRHEDLIAFKETLQAETLIITFEHFDMLSDGK